MTFSDTQRAIDSPPAATTAPPRPLHRRFVVTAIVHLLVIAGGVGWAAYRYRESESEKALPPLRTEPLSITPLYDDPQVVSDAELERVLWKLRPQLRGPNPKINNVDHALRFWGLEATFADPGCLSGVEMREMLTDHRRLAEVWEPGANSLLISTLHGVGTRVQQGHSTSSHVDHTVATLAEVGTPPDFPLITPDGETTFQAMLDHARGDFRLNQVEYEWSALVFALYMPYDRRWVTQEGQWIDFDHLAARIMRQEWTRGVCFGNHRLFTLAALLRVDEMQPILGSPARSRIVEHLRQATELLVANQREEGSWEGNWDGTPSASPSTMAAQDRRILATGHALEWWAIAPAEVQPPREVVIRAGQWLVKEIDGMSEPEIRAGYTFLTHAGRALALWRNRRPAEVVAGRTVEAERGKPTNDAPATP
ncbi:MAG: hypothetical protein WD069_18695 [Planctomycetales bacterium]